MNEIFIWRTTEFLCIIEFNFIHIPTLESCGSGAFVEWDLWTFHHSLKLDLDLSNWFEIWTSDLNEFYLTFSVPRLWIQLAPQIVKCWSSWPLTSKLASTSSKTTVQISANLYGLFQQMNAGIFLKVMKPFHWYLKPFSFHPKER